MTDLPEAAAAADPAPPRRAPRWRANLVRLLLGLGAGLAIAEAAFWVRDGGAFPHVNVYLPDPRLGVRLAPGASERIRFSNNPVTKLRINGYGYRGAEWPPPSPNDVIVVGDSQTFGLGVEENETFSSVLQEALGSGAVVRNLGVPTYGPYEYGVVVEEALSQRPTKTVVYVVNLANDLFEASHRNRDRHAVWDGWAVRKETAPAHVVSFPGRSLLYTHSHAFFALRGYLHAQAQPDSDAGFASEGTWTDIAGAATTAQREHALAEAETARLAELRETQLKYARAAADDAAATLDWRLTGDEELVDRAYGDGDSFVPKETLFRASRLSPGDIVTTNYGEVSRDVRVNAEHIRRGALLRIAVEKKARARAQLEHDKEMLGLFDKREAAAQKVAQLTSASPAAAVVPMSPLTPDLRSVKETCDRYRVRLVVVALPIDVQVSKAEWSKYGVEPVDMTPTRVLNDDVLVAARALGAEGFDALPALAAAEPGAFLDGDLHMTPKGHRALGEALAKVLRAPPPAPRPADGLPAGRSLPPRPDEWTANTEINVRESDPAGCETKLVREWLGIFCRNKGGAKGVRVTSGTEVMAGSVPGEALLVAPLFPGQDVKATFAFDGATRELTAKTGAIAAAAEIAFSKPMPAQPDIPGPRPDAAALCACITANGAQKSCSAATAPPDEDCARTYASDCAKLLACTAGDPSAEPECPAGRTPAGAAHRCVPLCGVGRTCAAGRCTTWQGVEVCL